MKVAVTVFPGSNCDKDTQYVLKKILKIDTDLIWHTESNLSSYDAIILPGGFTYGDYLRAGVIAAFNPIMRQVKEMADDGKPVLGICNGFQTLVEAGLLPGALINNISMKFICKWTKIRVESKNTVFTNLCKKRSILNMPIAHQQGRFFINDKELNILIKNDQIIFIYVNNEGKNTAESNPNGSLMNIAGVSNKEGNVVGLMPHPERASESILNSLQSEDGLMLFKSMINYLKEYK